MKTKRFLSLVAISIALSFTFFGCSSDDGGGDSQERYACQLPSGGGCIQATISDCSAAGGNTVETCAAGGNSSSSVVGSSSSGGTTGGKTNPTVTWPTGLTATVGQTLSQIALPGNVGTPGVFTWTTPTVSVGDVGQQSHSVTFTPTDANTFNTLMNNVTVTVSAGNDTPPNDQISYETGKGTQESRRYRVEVYNINSATYTYLSNTYSGKNVLDIVKADVISRGHAATNSYTNQTFALVLERYTSAANSINVSPTTGVNWLTEALQTNRLAGHCVWFGNVSTSTYRFFNVGNGSVDSYTVELYNINSATYTYLTNTYSNKTTSDVVRADVISRGHTVANTYTNQTFSDVTSRASSVASGIGASSNLLTQITDILTRDLQTYNQSGKDLWFSSGSNYRYFYVTQE